MAAIDSPHESNGDAARFERKAATIDAERSILINEVSWGAVLAGVALAIATQLILNMLGIALGAASVSPVETDSPSVSSFSASAGVWWAVSGIVAAFIGGIAAGRLAGTPKETTAGWHGVIAWAFTTIFMFYLLTSAASSIAASTAQTVGNMAGGAMRAAAPLVARQADPFASIEQQIRSDAGGQDPQALRTAAVSAVRALVTGREADAGPARERAAQALSRAQSIPIEQARAEIQRYEYQYRAAAQEARQQATAAAETARKTIASGSLSAAISLIIGALAGWFGGQFGVADPAGNVGMARLREMARRTYPARDTPPPPPPRETKH